MTHAPWCGAPRGYSCICLAGRENKCEPCGGWGVYVSPSGSQVACIECLGSGQRRDAFSGR